MDIASNNEKEWSQIDEPLFLERYDNTDSVDRRNWFAKVLSLYRPKSVLELGCNTGANLRCLQSLDPTIEVFGIDIHPGAIEWAKRANPGGTFVTGSIYDSSNIFKRKFDLVFTCGVLIHIPPEKVGEVVSEAKLLSNGPVVHLEEHSDTPRVMRWAKETPWRWAHNYRALHPAGHIFPPDC